MWLFYVKIQLEQKSNLKDGLAGLPAPKNDYEIVIPEQEGTEAEAVVANEGFVEDQADLDQRREEELAKQSLQQLNKNQY